MWLSPGTVQIAGYYQAVAAIVARPAQDEEVCGMGVLV
jgi:hypothetical protein